MHIFCAQVVTFTVQFSIPSINDTRKFKEITSLLFIFLIDYYGIALNSGPIQGTTLMLDSKITL